MAIFKRIDADHNGSISLAEAREVLGRSGLKRRTLVVSPVGFDEPDALAADETLRHQQGLTDDEIEALLRLHDTNGDGQLQFDEFIGFWGHLSEKRLKPPAGSYAKLDPHGGGTGSR